MTEAQFCRRCEQEVRYGVRDGITGWLHRDAVDHAPLFGTGWTPELQAKIEASLAEMAARGKADKKTEAVVEVEEEPDVWAEVPEPCVTAQPIGPEDFDPKSGIRIIYNLVTGKNKDKVKGWEVVNFTLAIGPYVGARGQVLSISDSVKMVMRGPEVDNGRRVAVASWRDGAFDFAYIGILKGNTVFTEAANSTALKAWIKETPP